jgi:hypothetical protein
MSERDFPSTCVWRMIEDCKTRVCLDSSSAVLNEKRAWDDKVAYCFNAGDRGSTVVKVLHYKSEGCWFDPI